MRVMDLYFFLERVLHFDFLIYTRTLPSTFKITPVVLLCRIFSICIHIVFKCIINIYKQANKRADSKCFRVCKYKLNLLISR